MAISFGLYGTNLIIDDKLNFYNDIRKQFYSLAKSAEYAYRDKYKRYGSIEKFLRHGFEDGVALIWGTAEKHVITPLIQEYHVTHIDLETFLSKYYLPEYFVWEEKTGDIVESYMRIAVSSEQADRYRTQRRQNRSRVIGGGFGLGGAAKGMLTAGAMNTAWGAAHGVFNIAASSLDAIVNRSELSTLYQSASTWHTLSDGILLSVQNMHLAYWRALNDLGLVKKRGDDIACLVEENRKNAAAILNNMGKIDEAEAYELFPQVLMLNPYDKELYRCMLLKCGDRSNELEAIATYFDVKDPLGKTVVAEYKSDIMRKAISAFSREVKSSEFDSVEARSLFLEGFEKFGDFPEKESYIEEVEVIIATKEGRVLKGYDGSVTVYETQEEAVNAEKKQTRNKWGISEQGVRSATFFKTVFGVLLCCGILSGIAFFLWPKWGWIGKGGAIVFAFLAIMTGLSNILEFIESKRDTGKSKKV
jgi:hypothetical protein